MATSGTTTFNPEIVEVIEEAYEMAGVVLRSGYDYTTARRSLDFLLQEWGNRGVNLWTVRTSTIPLVAGTITYNLPADTVDIIEHQIRTGSGTSQQDYTLTRVSVSDYAKITNKLTRARPTQVYIDRQLTPTITVYPAPDQSYTLAIWYLRRIEDTGQPGANTLDTPVRFLPCLVLGLAYKLSLKKGSTDRSQTLKMDYEQAFLEASGEDRDKAAAYLRPANVY